LFVSLKLAFWILHVCDKKNQTLVVSLDQQFLNSFKKCYLTRQRLAK